MTDTAIRPFRVEIPQAALDELAARLRGALWPDELPGSDGRYGMTSARVQDLAKYWLDGFDWRAVEARLNSYPQFVTDIDGQRIHFLHVRSPREDATPLLLSHGWPGSVIEYLDVIAPLTEPAAPTRPRSIWSSRRCRGSASPGRPAARAGARSAPRGPGPS